MMLENKYSQYRDLKKRVIMPAIHELNDTGEFNIDIKENRSGKQVVSIDFIVKDKDKRKYFNNISETKTEKENIKIKEKENNDFYIPNKKLFTSKTLENFKIDFKNYDFKDSIYKKLLQESVLVALEKDDEEKIKVKSYNYFKKTLENKINNIKDGKDNKSINTRFHNINQTFKKYDSTELEKILKESQKGKF